MKNKKRVLFIEDSISNQRAFLGHFSEDEVDITLVGTKAEAFELFNKGTFDLIVVDACLRGDSPDTLDLVRHMRKKFNGPMVASSTFNEYNDMLVNAGCDIKTKKGEACFVVEKLLEAMP